MRSGATILMLTNPSKDKDDDMRLTPRDSLVTRETKDEPQMIDDHLFSSYPYLMDPSLYRVASKVGIKMEEEAEENGASSTSCILVLSSTTTNVVSESCTPVHACLYRLSVVSFLFAVRGFIKKGTARLGSDERYVFVLAPERRACLYSVKKKGLVGNHFLPSTETPLRVRLHSVKYQSWSERNDLLVRSRVRLAEKLVDLESRAGENETLRSTLHDLVVEQERLQKTMETERERRREGGKKAEERARKAEERLKEEERKKKEAEERATRAEERATRAEERAKEAEERAKEAEERATRAEERLKAVDSDLRALHEQVVEGNAMVDVAMKEACKANQRAKVAEERMAKLAEAAQAPPPPPPKTDISAVRLLLLVALQCRHYFTQDVHRSSHFRSLMDESKGVRLGDICKFYRIQSLCQGNVSVVRTACELIGAKMDTSKDKVFPFSVPSDPIISSPTLLP